MHYNLGMYVKMYCVCCRFRMPEKCCVPGCRGNYQATAKHEEAKVSVFRCPKDAELRAKWIRLIPRANLQIHDKTIRPLSVRNTLHHTL